MTDTPQANTDIADYRLAVERHLSDLPAPIREDLLNGLEEHLTEVAADLEPGVPLSHLLGSPEVYARELRETVEVRKAGLGERFRRDFVAPAADRVRSVSDRFAKGTGFEESSELRKALKPGWWVLRGLIAAGLIVYFAVVSDGGMFHTFRELGFISLALVAALTLFIVWLSLKLGTRSQRWGRGGQWAVAAGGLVLFGVGLISFISVADRFMFGPSMTTMNITSTDLDHVRDVYVYTEDGELLTDVYLFDEHGNPLMIGDPSSCGYERTDPFAPETGLPGQGEPPYGYDPSYGYLYPLCASEDEPTGLPGATTEPPAGESPTAPVETPSEDATTPETPTASPSSPGWESPTAETPTAPSSESAGEPATTGTPGS